MIPGQRVWAKSPSPGGTKIRKIKDGVFNTAEGVSNPNAILAKGATIGKWECMCSCWNFLFAVFRKSDCASWGYSAGTPYGGLLKLDGNPASTLAESVDWQGPQFLGTSTHFKICDGDRLYINAHTENFCAPTPTPVPYLQWTASVAPWTLIADDVNVFVYVKVMRPPLGDNRCGDSGAAGSGVWAADYAELTPTQLRGCTAPSDPCGFYGTGINKL